MEGGTPVYCEQRTKGESHGSYDATSKLCERPSNHVTSKKQKDSEGIVGRIRPFAGERSRRRVRIVLSSGEYLAGK
jgi:hypothetical protein